MATMRGKSKVHQIPTKPPAHLNADGIDDWYMQQRQREKEMKKRRKEAEALLRGYRASYDCLLYTSPSPRDGATSRMPSSA